MMDRARNNIAIIPTQFIISIPTSIHIDPHPRFLKWKIKWRGTSTYHSSQECLWQPFSYLMSIWILMSFRQKLLLLELKWFSNDVQWMKQVSSNLMRTSFQFTIDFKITMNELFCWSRLTQIMTHQFSYEKLILVRAWMLKLFLASNKVCKSSLD